MMKKSYRELEIKSSFSAARQVEDEIVRKAQACGHDEEVVFAVRLSLEEAMSNAIRHGNVGDISKKINVRYHVDANSIDVYVGDEGQGFDPSDVPDPTMVERLEYPSGRGIMLMRAYMNEVHYNERGNEVRLIKLDRAS